MSRSFFAGLPIAFSFAFACQREAALPRAPQPVAAAPETGPSVIPEPSEVRLIDGDAGPAAASSTLTPPAPEPGIVRTGGAPARGRLAPGVLEARLESAMPALRACYERELVKNPTLRGHLQIDFVISPEGSVVHAAPGEVDDALSEPAVIECVLAEVRVLAFPKPSGGRVFASFPLNFAPPPALAPNATPAAP